VDWGKNNFKQLGDKTNINRNIPVTVDYKNELIDISAGKYHFIFLAKNGVMYMGGRNNHGQLGNDNLTR